MTFIIRFVVVPENPAGPLLILPDPTLTIFTNWYEEGRGAVGVKSGVENGMCIASGKKYPRVAAKDHPWRLVCQTKHFSMSYTRKVRSWTSRTKIRFGRRTLFLPEKKTYHRYTIAWTFKNVCYHDLRFRHQVLGSSSIIRHLSFNWNIRSPFLDVNNLCFKCQGCGKIYPRKMQRNVLLFSVTEAIKPPKLSREKQTMWPHHLYPHYLRSIRRSYYNQWNENAASIVE